MLKKAQISIFLIIAMIIVAIIIFISYYSNNVIENTNYNDIEHEKTHDFLSSCFENSYYKSLQNVGFHGGYFIPNEEVSQNLLNMHDISNYSYAVYLINNVTFYPSLQNISEEISLGTLYYFDICINNSNHNFTYNLSSAEIETNLEESIRIELNLDIKENLEKTSYLYSTFKYNDEFSNLLSLYELSLKLIESEKLNYENICNSCINNISKALHGEILVDSVLVNENIVKINYFLLTNKTDNEYNDVNILGMSRIILYNNKEEMDQ